LDCGRAWVARRATPPREPPQGYRERDWEARAGRSSGRFLAQEREATSTVPGAAARFGERTHRLARHKDRVKSDTVTDLGIRDALDAIADPFNDLTWCERFEQEAGAWRASTPQIPDYPSDWSPDDHAAIRTCLKITATTCAA
jgi:hypothetical protein